LAYLVPEFFGAPKKTDSKKHVKKRICVILRDWNYNDNYHVRNILKNIDQIISLYHFTYVSLDSSDHYYINNVGKIKVYNPSKEGIHQIIHTIKNHDMIITSRAHGAYLGSIMNIPSICINIEPKLKNVHETLSNSSVLIPENITSEQFNSVINLIFSNYDSFQNGSGTDLTLQREKASGIMKFFDNNKHELSRIE
jgi:polysaccharide pyruvyl transferase WcaK-like protein